MRGAMPCIPDADNGAICPMFFMEGDGVGLAAGGYTLFCNWLFLSEPG